jgi:hypothetical protein
MSMNKSDVDFVNDIAAPLPMAVIAELMGAPESRVSRAALYRSCLSGCARHLISNRIHHRLV